LEEQGTVTLDVTIDESGTVTQAVVQTSSGSERLDQAAVDWVKAKWRWNPPTTNGKPSSARTLVRVVFNLKNAH
jgi:protein TonB